VGQLCDSIIPQLDHLFLDSLLVADVEHLLVLSTSLQSLRVQFMGSDDDVSKVPNQVNRINVKDLHYLQKIERASSDNWETDFESIQKFKKLVEGKEELKELELGFIFEYHKKPSELVSAQALARWKGIKGELELTCVKKGIEVVAFTYSLSKDAKVIWEA
jgi:hypothetical protein